MTYSSCQNIAAANHYLFVFKLVKGNYKLTQTLILSGQVRRVIGHEIVFLFLFLFFTILKKFEVSKTLMETLICIFRCLVTRGRMERWVNSLKACKLHDSKGRRVKI